MWNMKSSSNAKGYAFKGRRLLCVLYVQLAFNKSAFLLFLKFLQWTVIIIIIIIIIEQLIFALKSLCSSER